MSDVPIQLIVAAFKDEKTANEALKALKKAQKEKQPWVVWLAQPSV